MPAIKTQAAEIQVNLCASRVITYKTVTNHRPLKYCIYSQISLTLVLQRGVATIPKQFFSPVLKNMQPRDKIALDFCKFILSPHFREKI